MTDEQPIRSATPDDIEAALRSVRAQILPGAEETPPSPSAAPSTGPAEEAVERPALPLRDHAWIRPGLLALGSGVVGAVLALMLTGRGEDGALREEVATLTQRLVALEQRETGGDPQRAGIDGRIGALETLVQQRLVRNAALSIVVSRLTAASQAGRPFVSELTALQQIAPEIDMSSFQPVAATGIPSTARLAADLAALGPSTTLPPPGLARLWHLAFDVAETTPSPYGDAARLASAGDIAGALQLLRTLPAPQPQPVQNWIVEAERRRTFDDAMDALSASLLRDLTRSAP